MRALIKIATGHLSCGPVRAQLVNASVNNFGRVQQSILQSNILSYEYATYLRFRSDCDPTCTEGTGLL